MIAMSDAPANKPELILVLETQPPARDFLLALIPVYPPACVIIAPTGGLPAPDDVGLVPPPTAAFDRDTAKALIEDCQAAGIAALIAEDSELAKSLGADGVHLTCSEDIAARHENARKSLGPTATVGVLSDMTRHTAMVAGETGADYLAFDLRPGAAPEGLDFVAWWAEIFEIPAVAFIGFDADRAGQAITAGAEFLALTPPVDATTPTPDLLTTLLDDVRAIMSVAS